VRGKLGEMRDACRGLFQEIVRVGARRRSAAVRSLTSAYWPLVYCLDAGSRLIARPPKNLKVPREIAVQSFEKQAPHARFLQGFSLQPLTRQLCRVECQRKDARARARSVGGLLSLCS